MNLDPVEALVHSIKGTIIVYNEGWGDTIPDWIMTKITEERLIQNMQLFKGAEIVEATDAEAMAYLYTMSLAAGMKEELAQVYFYLCGKYMPNPLPFVPEALTESQQSLLSELKRNIRRDSVKAFSKKLRSEMK